VYHDFVGLALEKGVIATVDMRFEFLIARQVVHEQYEELVFSQPVLAFQQRVANQVTPSPPTTVALFALTASAGDVTQASLRPAFVFGCSSPAAELLDLSALRGGSRVTVRRCMAPFKMPRLAGVHASASLQHRPPLFKFSIRRRSQAVPPGELPSWKQGLSLCVKRVLHSDLAHFVHSLP